ncbi:hypothetical protein DUI87_18068 [Hirundo rustica rustica]|uniref:Uncharacterized protein n=1 Tax=Hirundo rustica rustica TaxID=333673 RepID=A0A3M0JV28_HIRRU|nr:hypothetical protein DUI87_18068 [Hirundo rustica rustica]
MRMVKGLEKKPCEKQLRSLLLFSLKETKRNPPGPHREKWRELILEQILVSLFLSDLNDGTECTPSKFAEDMKLRGVIDRPDGYATIQGDLNNFLEK